MAELIYKDESYKIIGACFEVYNHMSFGFLEQVYQECLSYELTDQAIPFTSQGPLKIRYKQRQLNSVYIPDFLLYEKIILEIKGVSQLDDSHRAQDLNYLKATGLKLGLLVNFGNRAKLEYERIVL